MATNSHLWLVRSFVLAIYLWVLITWSNDLPAYATYSQLVWAIKIIKRPAYSLAHEETAGARLRRGRASTRYSSLQTLVHLVRTWLDLLPPSSVKPSVLKFPHWVSLSGVASRTSLKLRRQTAVKPVYSQQISKLSWDAVYRMTVPAYPKNRNELY